MADPPPLPPRPSARAFRPGAGHALAALLALLGASLALSWAAGLFAAEHRQTWAWLVQAAVLNGVVLAGILWAHGRLTRRRAAVERLGRELGYLRTWPGPEGVLRKEGLIRNLNALGVAPVELGEAVLAGARLDGADLRGTRLRGADLRGAQLQGAQLAGADLWGAELAEANLSHAGLQGANLRGAGLENATLVKADLSGANLHRANLVNANLEGVRLEGVRLTRARFALREPGLPPVVHASIEDWVRERLDEAGCYQEPPGAGGGGTLAGRGDDGRP